MKKYLFGMLALALAVGFSAFTKPAKTFADTLVFEFKGNPTVQSDVSDKSQWEYIGLLSQEGICDAASDIKACRFVIDATKLSETPAANERFNTVLGSSAYTITPTVSATATFYGLVSVAKTGYSATVSNQLVE